MDKIKLFLISLLFIYSTLNAKVTLKAPDNFYSDIQKLIWFIIGISIGILISFIFIKYKYRSTKVIEHRIEKDIKKANSKEELLKILIGYIDIDKDLDKIILSLDSNTKLDIKNSKKRFLRL